MGTFRINESTLRGIIAKAVRRALREQEYPGGVFSTDTPEFDRYRELLKLRNQDGGMRYGMKPEERLPKRFADLNIPDDEEVYDDDERGDFQNSRDYYENPEGTENMLSSEFPDDEQFDPNSLESLLVSEGRVFYLDDEFDSDSVWDKYKELKEVIGADTLCDEIAGKLDARSLWDMLKEIDGMYATDDDDNGDLEDELAAVNQTLSGKNWDI